ncbi:MAG: molecular chaperone HtpG [Campylobacter sp.]|nr:molecular chaperone HtpG [Campylobacter sp.]
MEKFEFQTEVNDLLSLMIHSLYSNKEIFLRELISNASDALDKLHYLTITDEDYKTLSFTPKIDIKLNKEAKTLSISDNGIGMNKDELIQNLGTIAKSGTKNFIKNLSGDHKKDSNLIGQFGVGFYSAFMVADKIEVLSKKPLSDEVFVWSSDASSFSIERSQKDDFGTIITLHMKDDEFLNEYRIESIIKKYSNHIPYPIFMDKSEFDKDGKETTTNSQINRASALWQMPKSSLKASDYEEFYKQISHDSNSPLFYIHTKAEGKVEYTTLFYIPSVEPFDLYRADYQSGVKLYVKRVFITDDEKELLPSYLRFVRGIIDVEDLPLNVSREILQDNAIMRLVKEQSVKKILSELEKLKTSDKEKYEKFFGLFGKVLKEGLYGFNSEKENILKLCLFKSNLKDEKISLDEYKQNMPQSQKEIYFITGKNYETIKNSPMLEKFNQNGTEVIICDDEIDAIVMPMAMEYSGVPIKAVSQLSDENENITQTDSEKAFIAKLKDALKDEIKEAKFTDKLTNFAACLVFDKNDPDFATQQILRQMGQNIPEIKPILAINKNHAIIQKLLQKDDINSVSHLLLDIAKIQDGIEIKDTNSFAKNLTEILAKSL